MYFNITRISTSLNECLHSMNAYREACMLTQSDLLVPEWSNPYFELISFKTRKPWLVYVQYLRPISAAGFDRSDACFEIKTSQSCCVRDKYPHTFLAAGKSHETHI